VWFSPGKPLRGSLHYSLSEDRRQAAGTEIFGTARKEMMPGLWNVAAQQKGSKHMIPWTIRPYDAKRDGDAAYALWQAALGDLWPTTAEAFHRVLSGYVTYADGNHFVAERGGRLLGLVATQTKRNETNAKRRGSIPLLMVAPEARRQGIGTELLEMAQEHLRRKYARAVQIGAGGESYFWPGVPECLPGALAFFRAQGFTPYETSYDLVRDLHDYSTPPELLEKVAALGVRIGIPTGAYPKAVLEFEWREFREWWEYFSDEIGVFPFPQGKQSDDNILAAWDREGNVIGTLLMFTAASGGSQAKVWKAVLGDDMGGFGAVGVTEKWRNLGIGTALSARASEILKERGVRNSHIGWTWLLDLYGRLGYKPWRSYAMLRQNLSKETLTSAVRVE
jgi:GNAT superfamily N-acetyltransferase